MASFLGALNALMARNPMSTAVWLTGGKSTMADLLTQRVFEKKENIDLPRLALFASFGAAYQGLFQFWLWNNVMHKMFKPGNAIARVLAANLVMDPLLFFPSFYTLKSFVSGRPVEHPTEHVTRGLNEYRGNCYQDWVNSWVIWLPGHTVTAHLPAHLKIPWVASLSFGYVCVLSATRGNASPKEAEKKDGSCTKTPTMMASSPAR